MKTYENKEGLFSAMMDMDVNDVPSIITNGLDEADDLNMTFAKAACNLAKYLVENVGGEAQLFDVEAFASDDKMDDIVDRFGEVLIDLCELVLSHGEITGIEVLDEEE